MIQVDVLAKDVKKIMFLFIEGSRYMSHKDYDFVKYIVYRIFKKKVMITFETLYTCKGSYHVCVCVYVAELQMR